MTKEEFITRYENLIKAIANSDGEVEVFTKRLIKNAWDAGYEFRIQEEELNKGASF